MEAFPDFILGFDLVGQEDLGRPLIDLIAEILAGLEQVRPGKTNWKGMLSTFDLLIKVALKSKYCFDYKKQLILSLLV